MFSLYATVVGLAGFFTICLTLYFIVPIVIFLITKMYWNARFQAFSESFLEESAKSPIIKDILNRMSKD